MPVAAAVGRIAIKNVFAAFGSHDERVQRGTFFNVYRGPPGISRLAVGGTERLVVLRVAPLLGWLGPDCASVTA